jgi:hypothetical protein
MQYTLYLTIPLQAHVNVPRAEWFYAGLGIAFNIPLFSPFEKTADFFGLSNEDMPNLKGAFFVSLPIDVGFDFLKAGEGGGRLFLRFTPTFIDGNTLLPIGFIWQIYNFRIDTR